VKEKYALMAAETNDEHYLKAATELGDSQEVLAHQAIFSNNGIKLVERGVRVDSGLFERLLNHRLQVSIDESLTAEKAVTLEELRDQAEALIAERPFYGRLAAELSDRVTLLGAIGSIALPKAMAFRLTVARDRGGALFAHSLQVALIALYLGIRQELEVPELRALAAAALIHDIGMLHIDPEIMQADHRLDAGERRQLHAHPLTATMIVKQRPEYPQAVGRAILEHHERLDGSGYPRGLKGAEISVMGRILLLAEVVAAVLDKKTSAAEQRLSLILRLNHGKFDAQMSRAILTLLEQAAVEETDAEQDRRNAQRIKRLGEDFDKWNKARSEMAQYAAGAPAVGAFLTKRVAALERSLADAGLHPDQLKSVCADLHDQPGELTELTMLAREAGWQLKGIIHDVFYRFPTLETTEAAGEVAIRDWLLQLSGLLK
jgi:HD-GYP domain-containing protein (c-di-GMP phosphodiesterase class II)